MKNHIFRWLESLGRLLDGPQPEAPKYHTGGFVPRTPYEVSPGQSLGEGEIPVVLTPGCSLPKTNLIDLEQLIEDTMARWHGDQVDRRPLAKVLAEVLRPYLKDSAGSTVIVNIETAINSDLDKIAERIREGMGLQGKLKTYPPSRR